MFVLFGALKTVSRDRRRAQRECKRNTFSSTLLCGTVYSYIWIKCTPPDKIHRCSLKYCKHIMFVICYTWWDWFYSFHSVDGKQKVTVFFIICMLQMWLLQIICIHGIGCTAIDDISFWNKKNVPPNKQIHKYSLSGRCGSHFLKQFEKESDVWLGSLTQYRNSCKINNKPGVTWKRVWKIKLKKNIGKL